MFLSCEIEIEIFKLIQTFSELKILTMNQMIWKNNGKIFLPKTIYSLIINMLKETRDIDRILMRVLI